MIGKIILEDVKRIVNEMKGVFPEGKDIFLPIKVDGRRILNPNKPKCGFVYYAIGMPEIKKI